MGSYIGFGYPEGTYEEAVLQSDREAWEQGYQDDMERRFARRGEMGKERLWQWFTENPLAFVASHLLYKPLALTVSHLRTVDLMPDRLMALVLSLIHISEPTRQAEISYAVFCLKKKKTQETGRNLV